MAIGPIEMQGQILRTQDYSAQKHQEDARTDVAQANIQQTRQTQMQRQLNRVNRSEQSARQQMNQDASDKGSNEYSGDGGAKRNEARAKLESDGKVLIKGVVTKTTNSSEG